MAMQRLGWRATTATVVTTAVVMQGVVPAFAVTEDVATGYVDWGIRESWRSYMGANATTLEGGVTYNEAGTYRWPVAAGTYDDVTNTLTLDLEGSVHYQKYCLGATCVLDSEFSDLTLVISPDEAYIQGDYAGVLREDFSAGVQKFEDVRLADLDLAGASVSQESSWNYISGISATAGAGLRLYDAGEALDPVNVAYSLADASAEDPNQNETTPAESEAASFESATPSAPEVAPSTPDAPAAEETTAAEKTTVAEETASAEQTTAAPVDPVVQDDNNATFSLPLTLRWIVNVQFGSFVLLSAIAQVVLSAIFRL